jgi:SNF2 family DNA or RNA helicase
MIFKTEPYEYQRNAIAIAMRTLQDHNFLALFGEVGTGKTKIIIDTFINQRFLLNHMVVVCPKSLFSTWGKEIKRHSDLNQYNIIRWDNIKKIKSTASSIETMLSRSGYIFIINIESLQYSNVLIEKLMLDLSRKPSLIVLDESVKIQTPSAIRTKNSIKYSQNFTQRVIMTGTDISSGPQALFSQFQFLDKMFWKKQFIQNFTAFKATFCLPKKVRIQGGREIEVVKRLDEMTKVERIIQNTKLEKLNAIIAPYTIRILRKDCLDLPEQINIDIIVELSSVEMAAYQSMKKICIAEVEGEIHEAINAISVFSKLRQLTSGHIERTKIAATPSKLSVLLDDIDDNNETAIIVCYFQTDIQIVTEALQEKYGKENCQSYYGLNSDKDNAESKDRFEQGTLRFLVASHGMMAQGHNFQEHCSLMYIYSVDLNSETNAQFKGRIDRLGQKRNPVYKYLLAKDTIDIDIHEMIQQKMNLQSVFSNMGKNELLKMIKG